MGHRATEIRAGLKHPVIDGDGHWMEPIPIFLEYLSERAAPVPSTRSERCGAQGTRGTAPPRRNASTIACAAPSGGV